MIIDHLSEQTIALSVGSAVTLRLRKDAEFTLPVTLLNNSKLQIDWTVDHPLHVAYRWKSRAGQVLEAEGWRSVIPRPLEPGHSTEVVMCGIGPDQDGDYTLLISLVLEGVAWAADVASSGWCEIPAIVSASVPWPAATRNSVGARALRGAIGAQLLTDEIRRAAGEVSSTALPAHGASVRLAPVESASTDTRHATAEPPAESGVFARFRRWFRRYNGSERLLQRLEDMSLRIDAHLHSGFSENRASLDARSREFAELRELIADEYRIQHTRFGDLLQLSQGFAAKANESASMVDELLQLSKRAAADTDRNAAMLDDLRTTSESVRSEQSRVREVAAQVQNAIEIARAELGSLRQSADQMIQNSESFSRKQDHLSLQFNDLRESQSAFDEELRHGAVMTELVSSLRNIAAWIEIENGRGHIPEDFISRLEPHLFNLETGLSLQFGKLDSLLHRQTIGLPHEGMVLIRNRFGLLAIQDQDIYAIAYYSTGDLPEPGTVALVQNFLRENDTFVDVGANVGIYSLIGARLVKSGGRVIAVEPASSTMRALGMTIAINGAGRIVEAHQLALGAQNSNAELHLGITSGHNTLLAPEPRAVPSETVTIRRGDEVLGGARPALIKIDVEGAEIDVLEGLRDTFARSKRPSIIIEFSPEHVRRSGLEAAGWLARVREFGDKVWRIDDDRVSLIPLHQPDELPELGGNLFVSDALPKRLNVMVK